MRFDDTLETVLAADLSTPFGVHSAWRQLVDLVGRRRVAPETRVMAMLRSIRDDVPAAVRAASARALEFSNPPGPLVRLLARDEMPVALPVLRSARLHSAEWIELLPDLSPAARAVLRNRRDLSPVVQRALESFGPVDFVLPDDSAAAGAADAADPRIGEATAPDGQAARLIFFDPADDAPHETGTIEAEGSEDEEAVAAFAPVEVPSVLPEEAVAAALADEQQAETASLEIRPSGALEEPQDRVPAQDSSSETPAAEAGEQGTFDIADVVARIDAFWRDREAGVVPPRAPVRAPEFRFETDAKGVIRWVEGVSRAPLIGLGLESQGMPEGSRIDASAAGAFRHRAPISKARMVVEGDSDAAGAWLVSAVPVFDPASGRFAGYRGTGRRPRVDERAEPASKRQPTSADSLRQLMHELRTPTNAIAGFSEMIEAQMLGPVPEVYRERANVIRTQARELLAAIDDLDLAARIDSAALALVPGPVALRPLLAGIADDLAPLAELRGAVLALPIDDLAVIGDRRAVERLLSRLMATLVAASGEGERIGVRTVQESDDLVTIAIDRPRALAEYPGESVLGIDDEREDATLLGTGFALRLARNLARELGGSLVIAPDSLTLRLPAAETMRMGQAHLS